MGEEAAATILLVEDDPQLLRLMIRILEKAGFQREGILRAKFFSRGVWRDTAMWSIIREDWGGPRVLPQGHVRE